MLQSWRGTWIRIHLTSGESLSGSLVDVADGVVTLDDNGPIDALTTAVIAVSVSAGDQ